MANQISRHGSFSRGAAPARPPVKYDSDVPPGIDPTSEWRQEGSSASRRFGSTPQERAGNTPGYVPGYGRSALANNTALGGMPRTDFAAELTPHLGPLVAGQTPSLQPTPGITPAIPPVTPGSTPQMQQITGTQNTVRQITGLPHGDYANASFVPGQNSPENLARRDLRAMPNEAVQQAATKGKKVSDLPAPTRPVSDPYS